MDKLVFFLILQLFSSVAFSEADGPDYWAITGVNNGGYLNIRLGPSVQFSIIGKIPSDYKHLNNIACYPEFTINEWDQFNAHERKTALDMRWCKVKYKNIVGWVCAKFLTEWTPPDLN